MNKAIYFKGRNCSVCHDLFPKIQQHFKEVYPLIEFEVIQIEDDPEISAQYVIFTIPALLIIIDSKEQFRFVRHFSAAQIDEIFMRTYTLMFEE